MSGLEDALAALEKVKAAKVSPDGMPSPEEDAALTWRARPDTRAPEPSAMAKRPLPKPKTS